MTCRVCKDTGTTSDFRHTGLDRLWVPCPLCRSGKLVEMLCDPLKGVPFKIGQYIVLNTDGRVEVKD